MMSSSIAFYTLSTLALYRSTFAQADYSPCPILGQRYHRPSQVSKSPYVQEALQNLTAALNELVQSGGNSSYTKATPDTTTFSIALFDSVNPTDVQIPFIYEYHHSAPSLDETSVDADSVYNIGGLSQFLTVYTFLAATQDDVWYDPITKHLPELNEVSGRSAAGGTDWNHVLLVDLATQLAGIPREAVTSSNDNSRQSFLQALKTRRPVYQPGTTPIYSNAAFCLLALALEKITGKSFTDTVQESILSPLNISATSVRTPASNTNAIIPAGTTTSGWQIQTADPVLLAATGFFSTITDLSIIGRSILNSALLPNSTTNRWLKPHSYTSNPRNGVGMPFDIYTPTLTGTNIGPIIEIFTKLGPNGLYSPYFGLVPDHGVGFVILSADTNQAADLNAYADLIAEYLLPAMEQTAAAEATINYAGNYTSQDGASSMVIDVDGLSGLSVLELTADAGKVDVKGAYAQLNDIPAETLDMRLYPTNARSERGNGRGVVFRAVFQDTAAPVDAGTPTCDTWEDGVDTLIYNGIALDEFVFELEKGGDDVTTAVTVPALELTMHRG